MQRSVKYLSPAAHIWLTEPVPARVLHIFNRTCNLVDEKRRVISIVPAEVGAGPLSLVLDKAQEAIDFRNFIATDSEIQFLSTALLIDELAFDWSQAQHWDPRPDWEAIRSQPKALFQALPNLTELIEAHAPAGGLAPLLNSSTSSSQETIEAEWLEAARQPAALVVEGLIELDLERCTQGAKKLAGLGGGLTPSGDDFLIGAMHAGWAVLEPGWTRQAASLVAVTASPRTNPLSAAWLDRAALGEATQDWHILLEAILKDDQHTLSQIIRKLLRIGHTSGADALTGFVSVVRAVQLGNH